MRDLLLEGLDPTAPRRAALEQTLRRAIRERRLQPGTRLPSSRSLATDLGLARATVVAAYEQLAIEGYLVARHGVGTHVADLPASTTPPDVDRASADGANIRYDLRPGEPDVTQFPTTAWMRSMRRALHPEVLGYGDPRGLPQLRRALAGYLGRARAVAADAEGIRVHGGAAAGFGFIGEALGRRGVRSVAVEDPALPILAGALELAGLDVVPIPLDREGIDVGRLAASAAAAVVVTPAHHYPLGITMSPRRRADLIAWAREQHAWIIEDDYDGEFRFDRRAIGALQGLDPDRVLYVGTASKSLAPGLRLAWFAVPPALRADLDAVTQRRAGVSAVEQAALADFITTGALDRHLRTVRAEYDRRQRLLRDVLAATAPFLTPSLSQAGLHLAATIEPGGPGEHELIEAAAARRVGLFGFGPHFLGEPTSTGLVLGYSRLPHHAVAAGLEHLAAVLDSFA